MSKNSPHQKLIKRISRLAGSRLPEAEARQFVEFLNQVIHVHPDENLLDWSDEENFGAVYGLYSFARKRPLNKPLLKVFNPELENDGWTSKHSLIYFCQTDMPFLVASLRMALNRMQLQIHMFESNQVWVQRNAKGELSQVVEPQSKDGVAECIGYILIDSNSDQDYLDSIHGRLLETFLNVVTVVDDFEPMIERVDQRIGSLEKIEGIDPEEIEFLRWLRNGNFTFLGMSDFSLAEPPQGTQISEDSEARLGLMKNRKPLAPLMLDQLCKGFGDFYKEKPCLAFTKASQKSSVHRDVYSDYIVVKRFNDEGQVIGETRMLGLYTSRIYHYSTDQIPLLRSKGQWLVENSELDDSTHNGKTLIAILEGHPRDELIQASPEQSLDTILGIWKIYERRTIRLFMRVDRFEKFVSCIVYLPRELVRAETRRKIERLLGSALESKDFETTTQFLAESVLARIHMVFRITDSSFRNANQEALEAEIVELTRDWGHRFSDFCIDHFGEEQGRQLAFSYHNAFPASYRDRYSPQQAVHDLVLFSSLRDKNEISLSLFHEPGSPNDRLRLKLLHPEESLELSDIIPMLENLGSRVLVEHPFLLKPVDRPNIWIHDFTLKQSMPAGRQMDIAKVRETYQEAFRAIWQGKAENDAFNRLVFGARLDWRSVALIRAYARYLKQLGQAFSAEFVAYVLGRHLNVCRDLMALFHCYFDPRRSEAESERIDKLQDKINSSLETVENLNEDQVLRQYLALINATLRTNFFQTSEEGEPKPTIALKINTRQLDFAPEPRPEYETYIYSPRMEGVHLRGGKVARGGIRWSDRLEDFRTEILGLVKAQQVKNAVIVPTGAKGGFVAREAALMQTRDDFLAEGVSCYRLFIGSLLDLADNRSGDSIVAPEQTVRRDDDDPYLVVAADKGTATYSDVANELSQKKGHWLGDAFASGGSNGYDHKAMGITARGAWVAVQRHFRELGRNIQEEPFTAIGIGDMAGDVFGNGMLLSKQTKLVAAFNHLHIFIDPDPDPEKTWEERKRLFELPRSSWQDYNQALISKGGGIFKRSAKSISLSVAAQKLFGIEKKSLRPNELIHELLKAPVDLIWNGGIGTYVKASTESHAEAGDRANDVLRVDGRELRCKVFGEGGNLGLTQLGRMEYCQGGGICNTDFIDNSAGVDCSDHEVNIKILLNAEVEAQNLTIKQRNQLLEKMTDEVAELVLHNNYRQTLAISLAEYRKAKNHYDYLRFLEYLEEAGSLNRKLEFLPDDEALKDLQAKGQAWTRPELSVLVSYAKVALKQELLESDIASDPRVASLVFKAFPASLRKKYRTAISSHRLSKEIIVTQLANTMVNLMGFSYCLRQNRSLGASAAETGLAFVTVMELFDLGSLWKQIEALDYQIDTGLQHELFHQIMRLGRRSTRWFLRNGQPLVPEKVIKRMDKCFEVLMPHVIELEHRDTLLQGKDIAGQWLEAGVPAEIVQKIAAFDSFFLMPGIIDASLDMNCSAEDLLQLRFKLGQELSLNWLMQQLITWQPESRWQDLARESHVDELESLSRYLTVDLRKADYSMSNDELIERWKQANLERLTRFNATINSLRATGTQDLSVFTVALRELQDLVGISVTRL